MKGVGLVERAFQIAPECASIEEVRQRLRREAYLNVHAYLDGKQIRDQLFQHLDPLRRKPRSVGRHGRRAGPAEPR